MLGLEEDKYSQLKLTIDLETGVREMGLVVVRGYLFLIAGVRPRGLLVHEMYEMHKAGYRLSNMFCGTATTAVTNMIFTSLGGKCLAQTAAAAGPNQHLNAAVQAKRHDFSHSVSFQ